MKIRIINNDQCGPRCLRIRSKRGRFFTPTRCLTSTDINYLPYLSAAGITISYSHDISEITKGFARQDISDLSMTNKKFGTDNKQIRRYISQANTKLTIFNPKLVNPKHTKLEQFPLSLKDIRALIDLQSYAGLRFITIPDLIPSSSISTFQDIINKCTNHAESGSFNKPELIIPQIDMRMDSHLFKLKLDKLLASDFKFVALKAAPFGDFYPNYVYLQEKSEDAECLFHVSDVKRYWQTNWTTPLMHILQGFGVDSFALGMPLKHKISEEQKSVHDVSENSVRLLHKNSLGLLHTDTYVEKFGPRLNCKCPMCSGPKNVKSFCDKYEGLNILNIAAHVHEAFGSLDEFKTGREYIISDEFNDYLKEREYLAEAKDHFKNPDQTDLGAF